MLYKLQVAILKASSPVQLAAGIIQKTSGETLVAASGTFNTGKYMHMCILFNPFTRKFKKYFLPNFQKVIYTSLGSANW